VTRISDEQFAEFVTNRSGILPRSGYLLSGDHVVFPYFSDKVRNALRRTADLVTCQRTTLDTTAVRYGSTAGESLSLPML
jgi:hypothetical protein